MFHSFQSHWLQHTRLLCPSLYPWVCSNSCPPSWWCYLTILSSAIPLSFCLQPFPAQGLLQWVGSLHHMAKILEPQLQQQSFQRIYTGLISFRIDWFDLFAVQGTLKTVLHPLRDQCMISHVISAWSDTWWVHDQSRDKCMIRHVISSWSGM